MRKRRRRDCPVAAEVCESRTLLSGTATASIANGVLTVDVHAAGKVRVYEHSASVFWVSSIGSTPINRADKPFVVTGVKDVVVNIDAAASYDVRNVVRIGYEDKQRSAFPGSVTVNMGGDYNRLYFENCSVAGNVTIYRNAEDYVEFENAPVAGTITYIAIP